MEHLGLRSRLNLNQSRRCFEEMELQTAGLGAGGQLQSPG